MKVIRFEARDSLHTLNLITFIATTIDQPQPYYIINLRDSSGVKTAENPAHF